MEKAFNPTTQSKKEQRYCPEEAGKPMHPALLDIKGKKKTYLLKFSENLFFLYKDTMGNIGCITKALMEMRYLTEICVLSYDQPVLRN